VSASAGPILAFTALALAASSLLLVGGVGGEVEAGLVPLGAPSAPGSSQLAPTLETRIPLGPAPAILGEAELFLDAHYGDEAPAVRAALEAHGVDLAVMDAPLPEEELLAVLPTWLLYQPSERDAMRREKLAWPEDLTGDWLQARYGVLVDPGPDQLAAIDFLAQASRPEILSAADRYLDQLEAAMLVEYAEGRVRTSPFLAWPPTSEADRAEGAGFYTLTRIGGGWVASISLERARHSAAIDARRELNALVHQRDDGIREALLALQ